jgi:hypothetical protein
MKGILVGGDFSELIVRQKDGDPLHIGELLLAGDVLLQVHDLAYGSQISPQHLELIGGMSLEHEEPPKFYDGALRNYVLAKCTVLATIGTASGKGDATSIKKAKRLPPFFTDVRALTPKDVTFLPRPEHPLFLGKLRSGPHALDVPVMIDGRDAFSHHILIAATTGRGKSNLLKCLLWELAKVRSIGVLVLDPHDEYYRGVLDQHTSRVAHYSADPSPGGNTLRFNVALLRPHSFHGAVDWTDAQRECVYSYAKEYRNEWVSAIALEKPTTHKFHEGTLAVVRRRIMQTLNLTVQGEDVVGEGLFVTTGGTGTVTDICNGLEEGKIVVVDTSSVDGAVEILVGSIIATEMLARYKRHKLHGVLETKPVIGIILEEAPRVIGKEVLEQGPNIFSTIAREGRKFRIGLAAITQLPSLIPREILANMNTKIILGMEMKAERQSLIESAAQDLSSDDRAIASLDRGEAIVTSTFVPFALPIRIPRFEEHQRTDRDALLAKPKAFSGVKLG